MFIAAIVKHRVWLVATVFFFALGIWGVVLSLQTRHVFEESFRARVSAAFLSTKVFSNEVIAKDEKEISLLFVGDVMLSRAVGRRIEKEQDSNYPFLKIVDTLRAADIAFGNLEGPISARGENQGSEYSFRADPQVVHGLKFAGFDVMSVANNHILDWGGEALADTVDILNTNGIRSLGAGKNNKDANAPYVFTMGDNRIVFFGFTTLYPKSLEAGDDSAGISSFNLLRVKSEITEIKKSNLDTIVIVSFHWGDEYEMKANEKQREIAHALIDAGVDLIVGHHPHVIQEVERYSPSTNSGSSSRTSWIAYSLGNFIFDQNFSQETQEGLMLKVGVRHGKISSVREDKISISPSFQASLVEDFE